MPIGSGLSGQIGFVDEATYGTYVAPTRFLEFISESLKADVGAVEHFSQARGRVLRTARRKHYVRGAGGNVSLPVMTKGMNLLFEHMLGTHAAVQAGATSEYLHTSTVDLSTGKLGQKLTCQVGRPDVGATVRPFSYTGVKVVGWEFKCAIDEKLTLDLELDAESEETGESLASASYASGDDYFIFDEGGLTLGGAAISVREFTIRGAEALKTDRRFIGNVKKEPIANGEQVISGTLAFEFEALTRHGQWTAGTELENLIATFDTGVAIPSGDGENFKLVITIPKLIITGGGPNVSGPDVLPEQIEWKALYDGTNSPIKIENYTTDTAA